MRLHRGVSLMTLLLAALMVGCGALSKSPFGWLKQEDGWLKQLRADPQPPEPDILPETHYAAGQLFEKQNRLFEAVNQYKKAVVLDPEFVPAINRIGVCLNKMGHNKEADAQFLRAIAVEPRKAYLHNNFAFSLMMQRKWPEAERELRAAMEINPKYSRARMNLGIVMAKQARYDAAFREFSEVLGEPMAHYNLGLVYKSQKEYTQAAWRFKRALELEPRLVRAQQQLDRLAVDQQRGYAKAAAPRPAVTRAPQRGAQQAPAFAGSGSGGTRAVSNPSASSGLQFRGPGDVATATPPNPRQPAVLSQPPSPMAAVPVAPTIANKRGNVPPSMPSHPFRAAVTEAGARPATSIAASRSPRSARRTTNPGGNAPVTTAAANNPNCQDAVYIGQFMFGQQDEQLIDLLDCQ